MNFREPEITLQPLASNLREVAQHEVLMRAVEDVDRRIDCTGDVWSDIGIDLTNARGRLIYNYLLRCNAAFIAENASSDNTPDEAEAIEKEAKDRYLQPAEALKEKYSL